MSVMRVATFIISVFIVGMVDDGCRNYEFNEWRSRCL